MNIMINYTYLTFLKIENIVRNYVNAVEACFVNKFLYRSNIEFNNHDSITVY